MASTVASSSMAAVQLGSVSAQRAACQQLRPATAKPARAVSVVARAQKEEVVSASVSRRSVFGLVAATIAAGALANEAMAVTPVDIQPAAAGKAVLKNRDEAFDVDLPYKQRFTFGKFDKDESLARLKNSVATLSKAKPDIETKTWWKVQSTLRTELSYLRFDLEKLIALKPKEVRKALSADLETLSTVIEQLDYSTRPKGGQDPVKSLALYTDLESQLTALVAKIV